MTDVLCFLLFLFSFRPTRLCSRVRIWTRGLSWGHMAGTAVSWVKLGGSRLCHEMGLQIKRGGQEWGGRGRKWRHWNSKRRVKSMWFNWRRRTRERECSSIARAGGREERARKSTRREKETRTGNDTDISSQSISRVQKPSGCIDASNLLLSVSVRPEDQELWHVATAHSQRLVSRIQTFKTSTLPLSVQAKYSEDFLISKSPLGGLFREILSMNTWRALMAEVCDEAIAETVDILDSKTDKAQRRGQRQE